MVALLQGLSLGFLEESGDTARGCGPVVASNDVCFIALGALYQVDVLFQVAVAYSYSSAILQKGLDKDLVGGVLAGWWTSM